MEETVLRSFSEEKLEPFQLNEDQCSAIEDVKPDINKFSDLGPYYDTIKTEVESFRINTEFTIKNEPEDYVSDNISLYESFKLECEHSSESNKVSLTKNLNVFQTVCGLHDTNMFYALFNYISCEMRDTPETTKLEQLFSILGKLHQNEDSLYVNKYLFPSVYVSVVDLLYRKLGVLTRSITNIGIAEVLTPNFDLSQKVIIVEALTVQIKTNASTPSPFVKYLIGYTTFGDVFFVSKNFSGVSSLNKLIRCSGLLNKLDKEYWILFVEGERVCVTQVKKLYVKRTLYKEELISNAIQTHIVSIINRLTQHFKVLQSSIPDFMLYREDESACFLDKLVFVCCMILNMLPRCTYK